jgi:hypothetical protein
VSGLPHPFGRDYELRGNKIVDSATRRVMAGPEIPHNEAGVPIIPDDRFWLISGNRVERMEKRIAKLEEALRSAAGSLEKAGWNNTARRAREVLDHE